MCLSNASKTLISPRYAQFVAGDFCNNVLHDAIKNLVSPENVLKSINMQQKDFSIKLKFGQIIKKDPVATKVFTESFCSRSNFILIIKQFQLLPYSVDVFIDSQRFIRKDT